MNPAPNRQSVVEAIGVELTGALGFAGMGKARVALVHHLDDCKSVELCHAAVDNRYPLVMIDASMLPLSENIAAVKRVVAYAHPRDVHVVGEVGRIKGVGYEGGYAGRISSRAWMTSPGSWPRPESIPSP